MARIVALPRNELQQDGDAETIGAFQERHDVVVPRPNGTGDVGALLHRGERLEYAVGPAYAVLFKPVDGVFRVGGHDAHEFGVALKFPDLQGLLNHQFHRIIDSLRSLAFRIHCVEVTARHDGVTADERVLFQKRDASCSRFTGRHGCGETCQARPHDDHVPPLVDRSGFFFGPHREDGTKRGERRRQET